MAAKIPKIDEEIGRNNSLGHYKNPPKKYQKHPYTPQRKKRTKSKINLPEIQIYDYTEMSDDEIKELKPKPTGYNSYEGYRVIGGQRYYHGEIGPDGKKVNAPKLTDEEWAQAFEEFLTPVRVWNEDHTESEIVKEYRPAKFTSIDHRLMDIFNNERRVLVLIFRGAHKSACGTRRIKRLILDLGLRVVYLSSTNKKAVDYSTEIRAALQDNPKILKWYGYIIDDKRGAAKDKMYWQSQKGKSARDAGLTIGSAQGASQMGGHPDYVLADDPVEEDVAGHPVKRENNWRWYSKQIYPMLMGAARMIIIGTMKDPDDLYNKILDKETYDEIIIRAIEEWPNGGQREPGKLGEWGKWYYVKHRPATRPGKKRKKARIAGVGGLVGGKVGMDTYEQINWDLPGRVQYYIDDDPELGWDGERMSMQEFLLIRHDIGEVAFECEFQMNAQTVGGGYLKFDKIKPFTFNELPFDKSILKDNCMAFFDQAFGESNRSDYNCISVVSKVPKEETDEYYILDFWIWRGGGVIRKVRMIQEVVKKYPFIAEVGVEAGQINAEDTTFIENALSDSDIVITPVYQNTKMKKDETGVEKPKLVFKLPDEVPKEKRVKCIRILGQWTTKLTMERIYMREGINEEAMNELKNEDSFPLCKRYDVLDSIGSAFDLCDENGSAGAFWLSG